MKTKQTNAVITLLAFFIWGCAAVQTGNDPVVVHAEQTTTLAVSTFKLIEKSEYESYDSLKAQSPGTAATIRNYVNTLRSHQNEWLTTARDLTKAYKNNRTPENKASLATALAVLSEAIAQSNKYLAEMPAGN
jgi:hypothetical protein